MAKKKNIEIIKKHLILCEGEDEYKFLIPYLNSQTLADYQEFSNDIQVLNFGGNEELKNYLGVLKNTDGFESVETILIIRDAERDVNKAISQIRGALQTVNLPIPQTPHKWETNGRIRIGFLLFPNFDENATEGTLEDLCITILKETEHNAVMDSIDSFLKTLEVKHQREFPHRFKTKLHTYFSVTDRYVSLKIGEAASAGAFDWESDAMNKLKAFITEIF